MKELFLDIYKRIDKFCRESFQTDKGITVYIQELEHLQYDRWYSDEWKIIYNKLKHYRHLRNKNAHEIGFDLTNYISKDDINWLEDFYHNLLNRQDPLCKQVIYKKSLQTKSVVTGECHQETASESYIVIKKKNSIWQSFKNVIKSLFGKR